ncbi:hypothetical protein GGS23DRAFT_558207 [Durotheca rogersii]|uniref:uncharacterized protein n=1 Tax=Durotheca rogersii TaxID=419775 RepID=UPI002220ADC2|nr:uncharacterized protein GGS23DRAFT_558207 [Durotheca rogersii]KAI5865216.1 hypothetical protein GGS23DRAFT_558207 [Durotheca rogersii]
MSASHRRRLTRTHHTAIKVVSLENRDELSAVTKDSKVCISVVLYWKVGEKVIQSCIENGTDYIDVAGDVPLLRQFAEKYHEEAVKARVILIHLCGVMSAPHDLLTWLTARELAQKASLKTKEVILTNVEFDLQPSGGTADSMIAESSRDPRDLERAAQPWVLSPVEGTKTSNSTNFFGMRWDPVLGSLSASSICAQENRALVHRTWGLLQATDQAYGPSFQYNEYNSVSSTLVGIYRLANTTLLRVALSIGPLRRLLKIFLPVPGQGPDIEKTRYSRVKLEAVAIADSNGDNDARRAHASFSYPSGPYHTTAALLGEGASSLLYRRHLEAQAVGGCLTPAFLGSDLIDRLRAAGATIKVNLV